MDKLQDDIKEMMKDVEFLIARKLPVAAGKLAKQHFQDNFLKGGFVNGGLSPWPPAKRLSSGGKGADSQYRTLMSSLNSAAKKLARNPSV